MSTFRGYQPSTLGWRSLLQAGARGGGPIGGWGKEHIHGQPGSPL